MAKAATLNIDIVASAEKALGAFDKVKEHASGSWSAMKVGATVAAGAVLGALGEATKAAAEHEAGVSKLAQAYKNAGVSTKGMSGALEEIDAASRKTGQSAEDNIAAYTVLITATRNTAKAHSELGTAEDLAAYKGISVKEAAMDITRAQEGNTRALKEMGIATTDAAGHQLSATAIMARLTQAVHGQADAFGQTAEGQMARYKESIDQAKIAVGEAFLPVLKSLLTMLQPIFTWMSRNQAIVSLVAKVIAVAAGVILGLNIALRAWAAIQAVVNVLLDANPIGLVVLAIAGLIAAVVLVVRNWRFFWQIIQDVWHALQVAGAWILAHWPMIIGAMFGPLGILIGYLATSKRAVNDLLAALKDIGHAVSDALGWLGKIPSGAGSILGKLNPFSLPGGSGPAVTPMYLTVYATPGADLPETVYQALRDYQRRHVRPELRPLFGG
jgi:hypothetical protein